MSKFSLLGYKLVTSSCEEKNLKNQFFELWDNETLYQLPVTFPIFSHLNISFLTNSIAKKKLETVMKTFNITHVVNFPTRISNNKGTLIYRLFLDSTKYYCISVYP